MATAYRIRDWDKYFETAQSRAVKFPRWVSFPIKHDGLGFRRLSKLPNCANVFCGWALMVQIAMKQPTRGTLCGDDGPLFPDDLSVITGFPSIVFDEAIAATLALGWLETYETGDNPSPEPNHASSHERSISTPTPRHQHAISTPSAQQTPQGESKNALNVPSADHQDADRTLERSMNIREGRGGEGNNNYGGSREIANDNADPEYMDDDVDPSIRQRVLQTIGKTPTAAMMSSVHMSSIVRLAIQIPVDEVCEAIKIAGEAKMPRRGAAFVSYVEQVLATRAHDKEQKQKRAPIYSSANPPPRPFVDGDGGKPRPVPSFVPLTPKPAADDKSTT